MRYCRLSVILEPGANERASATNLANGLKAGGAEPSEMRDYGFMQQRTIEDFDGHTWEIFYMDISKFPTEQSAGQ